jgi:post-segregation antitoxin (ccd killing protein)
MNCDEIMTEFTVVSAKVRKEVKEKIKKYKIPISNIIQNALDVEIKKREQEELQQDFKQAGKILKKVPQGLITELIREDREIR